MPRDTAGNYTLPAGNPVASGEIIAASWANSTMNDLGQSLSASLDRYGRGGMLAPFQFTDGTESAPGATWSNEPTTGLYRAAYGDLRFTLTGTNVQRWTNANSYLWRNSQWEEILTQTGGGGSTTINNLVVTGSFTSPGIDDNANATAITIDASENVGIGETDPSGYWTQASDLVVASTSNGGMTIKTPATGSGRLAFTDTKSATAGLTDGGLLSYEHTSDSMTFGTAGVQRAVIDGSGNVGIGTLTPTEKLSISGSTSPVRVRTEATTGSSGLRTSNTGGNFIFEIDNSVASAFGKGAYSRNVYADGAYPMVFWTNGNERMRIDASGNVGIGTDSPVSAGSTFGSVTASGSAGGEYYVATGGTAKGNFFNYTADVNQVGLAAVDPAGELVFSTGGYNERMRLDASGNVGIGYVSAYNNARLTVAGPSSVGTANSHIALVGDGGVGVGNGPQILFSDSGAGADFAGGTIGFERTGSNSIGDLVFGTRRITGTSTTPTTEAMRINSSGDVGIGTSSPNSYANTTTLTVGGTADNSEIDLEGSGVLRGQLYSTSSAVGLQSRNSSGLPLVLGTDGVDRVRIDASGSLLVGTTAAISSTQTSVKAATTANCLGLQNTNNNNYLITAHDTTAEVFRVAGTGNVLNTNNSYGALSDERLKSDIVDASSQLDDIMAVKVRNYTLDSTGDTHIGVVAQELEASGMGSLVDEDKDGMKSVKYSVLYMKAIKAIQEQQAMIETLQAEVAALKGA